MPRMIKANAGRWIAKPMALRADDRGCLEFYEVKLPSVPLSSAMHIFSEYGIHIAQLCGNVGDPQTVANAKLMAASTSLLCSCQAAVDVMKKVLEVSETVFAEDAPIPKELSAVVEWCEDSIRRAGVPD